MEFTWHDVKSEGAPAKDGWYLVTNKGGVFQAFWNKKQKKYIGWDGWVYQSVTAWMELPEPYEE